MIKKIIRKVLILLFVVIVCMTTFLTYQYIQYKNKEIDELKREVQAQTDIDLEQELLNEEIDNAKNFIKNIDNNIAITVLRTRGKLTLSHDKTPKNNAWTEWLFNSDIKVYANYIASYTIEMNAINMSVLDDATVNIAYDSKDINLSSIDITDFSVSENKSILGSSYTPRQIAAFENIARNNIFEKNNSETYQIQAKNNLETYFTTLASNFNVNIKVSQK